MPLFDDLIGNRLFIDETSRQAEDTAVTRNLSYTYDARYQLVSEAWDAESYVYEYDLAGNRLEMDHNGAGAPRVTPDAHHVARARRIA